MSNQQDPDAGKNRHEQRQHHELSLSALLGTEPAQRQALAAQLVQQWLQEAEQLVAQRHYQKAIKVYTRILVVNPGHLRALQGRAQVYCQAGMGQAAEMDERMLQALSSPISPQE
jgi:tetratricopeptide (TPR) repeat protein